MSEFSISEFYQSYSALKEREKINFSKLTNKLLSVNFISSHKEQEVEDYYFIVGHYELFKAYFSLMECELHFYQTDRVIMLQSNYNRLNLRLNESIVLLILRLIYDEKMREVSLTDKIIINLEMIHEKFLATGLKDRRISKTELKQILSLFRRHNLVEMIDYDLSQDDSRLVLYPTILYAVHMENINEVYKKISSYRKDSEQDEDVE